MFARYFRLPLAALVLVVSLLPGQLTHAQQTRSESVAAAPAVMGWQQVSANGFGDAGFKAVHGMAVFNNQLYAGAAHWTGAGAQIWRTSDGSSWSPVMTGGFGQPQNNPAIVGMFAFKSYLYAGTGWGPTNTGQLWRSPNGTAWDQITGNGLGVTTGAIGSFGVYGDALYLGTCANTGTTGAQIMRSSTGSSGSWTSVVTGGLTTTDNNCVTGFAAFNGALYAAVENPTSGARIWRSTTGSSGTWTQVNTNGFGSAANDLVGGFAIYKGYLYIGTHNAATGAQLWRSDNGTNWGPVMQNGFGDVNNDKLEALYVFNGILYAGLNNSVTGLEVWASVDGITWGQVNTNGFGDSQNTSTLWSNETIAFNNGLYIGVHNEAQGLEIWRRMPLFADVASAYWAGSYVERLAAAGITGGCATSPLQYCPEATVTRAQMAVFLERGIHGATYNPPAVGASTGFSDVPTTYWAASWIKQLAADGITGGCGAGIYCPESPVTRAEMAVFLLRSKHGASYTPPSVGSGTGFSDVPTTYWAAAWIKQLVAEGITSGCGTGTYCPESPVTRAQMAVFLVRTFNLP